MTRIPSRHGTSTEWIEPTVGWCERSKELSLGEENVFSSISGPVLWRNTTWRNEDKILYLRIINKRSHDGHSKLQASESEGFGLRNILSQMPSQCLTDSYAYHNGMLGCRLSSHKLLSLKNFPLQKPVVKIVICDWKSVQKPAAEHVAIKISFLGLPDTVGPVGNGRFVSRAPKEI